MTSAIDPTKPIDGVPASKADLRSNLQAARDEIEALQSGKTDLGHQHGLADITDAGALAGLDTVGPSQVEAGFIDPVEDPDDYSATPFTVADVYGVHRFFTSAQNHIVEFPAGLAADPAAHGKFTPPPANTLTLRRAAGSGVSINGVASDAYTWVVPAGGTVEWQVRATNTIELRGDTTAEQLLAGSIDGNGQRIFGYRNRKYGALSGAQTLSAANFEAGSKLVHTGGAATYTVPSRLAAGDTMSTEELKVRNGGSGAITWSASGVTLVGDTGPLAAGETAVLEWEHDGTTERVEIRGTA